MTMKRVDQGMAAAAASVLRRPVTDQLRSRYGQLPFMVRTAGLAATYAFLVAKSEPAEEIGRAYSAVADGIRAHLAGQSPLLATLTHNDQVVRTLADLPAADYARASMEIEALAGWLRRLAEAAYRVDKAGSPAPGTAP